MKFLVGFLFGVMALSAIAQTSEPLPNLGSGSSPVLPQTLAIMGGEGTDGRTHTIQVDAYGYVICSQMPPPTHWQHGQEPGNSLNHHDH